MRKLSLTQAILVLLALMPFTCFPDSPHGKDFKYSCDLCHSAGGWKLDLSIYAFDHGKTLFPLEGQHQTLNCRSCHTSLIFHDVSTTCSGCHTDLHDQTVGNECSRCHTPASWIVTNITGLHQRTRFPLLGPHNSSDCQACHASASLLRFDPQGVECIDCHRSDYLGTTQPNHQQGGYSTNCTDCHNPGSYTWGGSAIDHAFFPLTQGHSISCENCHPSGNFTNTPNTCVACHLDNYTATSNPNHTSANIPNTCADCHTTLPGWKPAQYNLHNTVWPLTGKHSVTSCNECHNGNYATTPNTCAGCHLDQYNQTINPPHATAQFGTDCQGCHSTSAWTPATFDHDGQYFPVYSGKHQGTWNTCSECHPNPSSYAVFTCISCHDHNQPDMDNEHSGVSGYLYNSDACFACHPTGSAEGSFNHNNSGFPLTGAHQTTACGQCHVSGYSGTTTVCYDCHTTAFNQSTNPNHPGINIPNTCQTCHTTNPGWKPAGFPIHNNYYVLQGAHAAINNNCTACHNGNYNNTPNTCVGCHLADYNQSNNPSHAAAQFPTTCETCHSQNAWTPSTFNHDGLYFPIYSGNHNGEWNQCSDCHTNPSNYQAFTCTTSCHPQNSTNNDHSGVSGYSYNSNACYQCHPNGKGDKMKINGNIQHR